MFKFFASAKEIQSNLLFKLVFVLIFISIYFMFSSTVILSLDTYGNPYRFGLMHFIWLLIGFIFLNYFYKIDLHLLKKYSFVLYFLSFVLLFLLALSKFFSCENALSFAPCNKGAIRWFVLNPKPLPEIPFIGQITFQPSELAKLALVIFLSFIFSSSKFNIDEKILRASLFSLPIILLVFFQPNKSTSLILFFIFAAIFYANGEKFKKLIYLIIPFLILFVFFMISNNYSYSRFSTFMKTNENESENYHQNQALISIGSGGLTGVGIGKSRQKFSFLPEISADSIFALMSEEVGFIGSFLIVIIYFSIIYQGFKISIYQKDRFNQFLGIGITTWIGIQAIINFFSMVGLIPLTGIPLPILSYGGSSTIFVMIGLGILLNLSRNVYEKK
jgi:cell division protein FtsW